MIEVEATIKVLDNLSCCIYMMEKHICGPSSGPSVSDDWVLYTGKPLLSLVHIALPKADCLFYVEEFERSYHGFDLLETLAGYYPYIARQLAVPIE